MNEKVYDVIVVGAGLAGLSCALELQSKHIDYLLLEASERPGGRVKTDVVNGFVLNRGFQVLQTAYPEAQRILDYDALDLKPFAPGAIFRIRGSFYTVADPVRVPRKIVQSLAAPIGSWLDRVRMLRLALRLSRASEKEIFGQPDMPTPEFLRREGFSSRMIDRFFKPFFSGVCLDSEIQASSRVFKYIFKMFSSGDIAIPAFGMEQIPKQMANRIPRDRILANSRAKSVEKGKIELESGEKFFCRAIVLAVEAPEAERLLKISRTAKSRGEYCLYFEAAKPPFPEPFLAVNAEGRGAINNLCVLDKVAPSYAPSGKSLVSVTVVMNGSACEKNVEDKVRRQLLEWFGKSVDHWKLLRVYSIRHALPDQNPPAPDPAKIAGEVRKGIYVCGEYRSLPSIQWALLSGRLTAEKARADLKKTSGDPFRV